MTYAKSTLEKYLKDLGAKLSAPGGGSTAAFASAMAASLIMMTCLFTLGKDKYKKSWSRIRKIYSRALQIQKKALKLVDADVRAYASGNLEESLRVPLEICFLSYDLIKLAEEVVKKGNTRLISDAAMAAVLAEAGFTGALFYVRVDSAALKDKAKKYHREIVYVKSLEKKMKEIRKKIEVSLGHSIGR